MSQHRRWLGPVRSFADRSLRAAVVRPSGTSRRHQSFVLENPVDRREGGLEFRNRSLTLFPIKIDSGASSEAYRRLMNGCFVPLLALFTFGRLLAGDMATAVATSLRP
jgi:hypothetical protein